MPILNTETPANSAAKNIAAVIDAMTEAQKSQLELKKAVMMKQIGDKQDLIQQKAQFEQMRGEQAELQQGQSQPNESVQQRMAGFAGVQGPVNPPAQTNINGLNEANRATNATAGTVGAQPMLPGQPQANPMAPTPTPQQTLTAPPAMGGGGSPIVPPSPTQAPMTPVLNSPAAGTGGQPIMPTSIQYNNLGYKPVEAPQLVQTRRQAGQPINMADRAYVQALQKVKTGTATQGEIDMVHKMNNRDETGRDTTITDQLKGTPSNNRPSLDQLYSNVSDEPFGNRQSDYMQMVPDPQTGGMKYEAIPQGILDAKNPLALTQRDLALTNDAKVLTKQYGYSGQDILNSMSPKAQDIIQSMKNYDVDIQGLSSGMMGGLQKQGLVHIVKSIDPQWSEMRYHQMQSTLSDYANPNSQIGKSVIAMNQGVSHMGDLADSIQAVAGKNMTINGHSIPVLNAGVNAIRSYVGGDPDILALKQNIIGVSNEMRTSWGTGRSGYEELKQWQSTMNAANSLEGWQGVLKKTATMWQQAADARESFFKNTMNGKSYSDVFGKNILGDDQKQILDNYKSGKTWSNGGNTSPSEGTTGTLNGRQIIYQNGKAYYAS